MLKTGLVQRFGQEGADLIERVYALAEAAIEEGWSLTKEAMIALPNSEQQIRLTSQAEAAYNKPLQEITQGYSITPPTGELLGELKLQEIAVKINVFDLYRRVKRLKEARDLGEKTLDDAIKTGDLSTILRAGNFVTLVQSAEAYEAIESKKYEGALITFRIIEQTLESLPLTEAKGKNAVMLYSNHAANYLNMVHVSRVLRQPLARLDQELASANILAYKGMAHLDGIENPQDEATWAANIYCVLGYVAKYKGDFDTAIKHFETALRSSVAGFEYSLQIAALQTVLAHTLITRPEPDVKMARQYFRQVELFLVEHSFGVDSYHFQPLVGEIRTKLQK